MMQTVLIRRKPGAVCFRSCPVVWKRHQPDYGRHRFCAVVIDAEQPYLILTKRTAHLPNHAGQICFPGGKMDQGETVMTTALRESHEEIGLNPDQVEPLGYLPGVIAAGKFHIAPVLGVVPPSACLSPDPGEVERIFPLPLDIALNHNHFREESIYNNSQYYQTGLLIIMKNTSGRNSRIIVQWHAAITRANAGSS